MEHVKTIVAWELMFILVFASLLIIQATGDGITGWAVQGVTKEAILSELEIAIPKLDFLPYAGDTNLCLLVRVDSTTKYSYEVTKIGDAVAVSVSPNLYCNGESSEDFIINYISYEKLKEHLTNIPSFQTLRQTSDGTNFFIYPSKQILPGLKLADPCNFEEKYMTLLEKYFTAQEIKNILNPSCAQTRGEAPMVSYTFYFVIGAIVLVVMIVLLIMGFSKKPEIKEDLEMVSYIKSMLAQGYDENQIREQLIQAGWQSDMIERSFQAAKSEVSLPTGFEA